MVETYHIGKCQAMEGDQNVFWRNSSDGNPRSAPVLNNEGDGLQLVNAAGTVVATGVGSAKAKAPEPQKRKAEDSAEGIECFDLTLSAECLLAAAETTEEEQPSKKRRWRKSVESQEGMLDSNTLKVTRGWCISC